MIEQPVEVLANKTKNPKKVSAGKKSAEVRLRKKQQNEAEVVELRSQLEKLEHAKRLIDVQSLANCGLEEVTQEAPVVHPRLEAVTQEAPVVRRRLEGIPSWLYWSAFAGLGLVGYEIYVRYKTGKSSVSRWHSFLVGKETNSLKRHTTAVVPVIPQNGDIPSPHLKEKDLFYHKA